MQPFDQNLLTAIVLVTTPILIAAVGEGISERAGVLNIGLEGMMLAGAFFAFWMAEAVHSFWPGVLMGALAGVGLAAIMAVLSINVRANQVIVGVGIWILGQGLTSFLFAQEFGQRQQIVLPLPQALAIPGLSAIPGVGKALFDQIPLVYLGYILVPLMWFVLFRTTWGLRIRSAGDLPDAAAVAGWNVRWIRWVATLVAGLLAGVSGAFLSIGQIGTFLPGMSNGRGFLAIAAVIFGAWRPLGILVACVVFGFGDALQLRLQGLPAVPWAVWFVLALIVATFGIYGRSSAGIVPRAGPSSASPGRSWPCVRSPCWSLWLSIGPMSPCQARSGWACLTCWPWLRWRHCDDDPPSPAI